jgi:rhodanese-related sulfurtransferase
MSSAFGSWTLVRDALLLCTAATALGVGSLAIQGLPWTPPPPDPASVVCGADEPIEGIAPALARIAVEELRRRVVVGDVVLVDARSFEDYAAGHIPGAISLPADEIDALLASQSLPIPNDRDVVTYCARPDAGDAEHVGRLLDSAIGCPRVYVLGGSPSASGWQAWIDAGAPVEGALQSG